MNKLDMSRNLISDQRMINKLPKQNDQVDETINTWDQLTDEQQQDILAHLTAIPFQ